MFWFEICVILVIFIIVSNLNPTDALVLQPKSDSSGPHFQPPHSFAMISFRSILTRSREFVLIFLDILLLHSWHRASKRHTFPRESFRCQYNCKPTKEDPIITAAASAVIWLVWDRVLKGLSQHRSFKPYLLGKYA